MKAPILYTFRRCPFAIRARASIYFSGIIVEIREVLLKDKPKEMIDASKKATVPVLVLEDKILDESLEIILWALSIKDELNILNPYRKEKANTLSIISSIDNEFKFHLDRYKYSSRFKESMHFKGKIFHRNHAALILNKLEKRLSYKNNYFLFDNSFSILDLCIFPLVRQFKIADINWFTENSKLKNLNKWLENILENDFFNIIMKKYKPWKNTNTPEFFSSNLKI